MAKNHELTFEPESFHFAVDYDTRDEPMIGMSINGEDNWSIIVPMNADVAESVAAVLQAHAEHIRAA